MPKSPPSQPTPISPQAAQRSIDSHWPPAPIEHRPLDQCTGRVLRQDVFAERDNPPFDRVCMDGIAINSATFARGVRRFSIERTVQAGTAPTGLQNPDNAIEVMTGAVLPHGTDSIIPMEEYDLTGTFVTLKDRAHGEPYRNIQRRGEDSQPAV